MKGIDASEIAHLAGVSRATVSRVINDYTYVKPATRERVLRIIEQHSYSPHFSAQILAGKRSNTIGFFFAANTGNRSRLEDTHVNFMIRQVINTAMSAGYYVLASQVADLNNPAVMKRIGDMFGQSRVDGGIFVGFPNECCIIEDLIDRGFPIGIFEQRLDKKPEPNRIVVNLDHMGIAEMVKYVAAAGHRDLLYAGPDMNSRQGVENYKIFREAAELCGIRLREDSILEVSTLSSDASGEAMEQFLKEGKTLPGCIISANDLVALGIIETLRRHGFRVPEDVSVVGSDDILVSQFFNPPLTTVHYDFDAMLETLTSKVINFVEHPFEKQYKGVWPGRIVIRSSCIAAKTV
ncbi:MAG: LacI family transcriptional regulator [Treponema sp.]|jgi:LacI family transcriptional regulator|nr:LacI family transcriptional regulator [Treponema sp.]